MGNIAWFYSRGIILEFVAGINCYLLSSRLPSSSIIHVRRALLAALAASLSGTIYIQGANIQLPIPSSLAMGILAFGSVLSATSLSKAGWDQSRLGGGHAWRFNYLLNLIHPYVEVSLQRLAMHRFLWLAPEFTFGVRSPRHYVRLSQSLYISRSSGLLSSV
jgi:hypothetical protein